MMCLSLSSTRASAVAMYEVLEPRVLDPRPPYANRSMTYQLTTTNPRFTIGATVLSGNSSSRNRWCSATSRLA